MIHWEQLLQDLRFGIRGLVRHRGWTAIALITLALGIGANSAVFSIVDAVLLHPVPYPEPDRFVQIVQSITLHNRPPMTASPSVAMAQLSTARLKTLDDVEAFAISPMTQLRGDEPRVVRVAAITPGLPRLAGVPVLLGRGITPNDVTTAARVVVLSEAVWRREYHADPTVPGTMVTLDGNTYTVVGVLAGRLQLLAWTGASQADLFTPLKLTGRSAGLLNVIGRLHPGASTVAAGREVETMSAPERDRDPSTHATVVRPADLVRFKSSLLALWAAVGLVLLIACANVAHLLMARGTSRRREIAIRTALGAQRGRLARQLVLEGLLLSSAGAVLGAAFGFLALRAIVAARPTQIDAISAATMDRRTLLAMIALTLVTGVVFGTISMLQVGPRSLARRLRAGAGVIDGHLAGRVRGILVVTEMAIATTLLLGALLLARNLMLRQRESPGFDPANLYAVDVPVTASEPAGSKRLAGSLLESIRAIPGVDAVSAAFAAPPAAMGMLSSVYADGDPAAHPSSLMLSNAVSPNFFELVGLPLQAGRTFRDSSASSSEVIVSASTAKKLWPGAPALGRRLRFDPAQPWLVVVGIAADLTTSGQLTAPGTPMFYLPLSDLGNARLLVRTAAGVDVIPSIRRRLVQIDPHLPPAVVTSLRAELDRRLAPSRFTALLLTLFAGIAVVLSAIGLYGVLAYTVARRTSDIGIRIALGANGAQIVRDVTMHGLALSFSGALLGLGGAFWTTRVIADSIDKIPRMDPWSFAAAALLIALITAAACIVPARRALAVDPMTAIRAE
jgi:putative ABC transport system permease protein